MCGCVGVWGGGSLKKKQKDSLWCSLSDVIYFCKLIFKKQTVPIRPHSKHLRLTRASCSQARCMVARAWECLRSLATKSISMAVPVISAAIWSHYSAQPACTGFQSLWCAVWIKIPVADDKAGWRRIKYSRLLLILLRGESTLDKRVAHKKRTKDWDVKPSRWMMLKARAMQQLRFTEKLLFLCLFLSSLIYPYGFASAPGSYQMGSHKRFFY